MSYSDIASQFSYDLCKAHDFEGNEDLCNRDVVNVLKHCYNTRLYHAFTPDNLVEWVCYLIEGYHVFNKVENCDFINLFDTVTYDCIKRILFGDNTESTYDDAIGMIEGCMFAYHELIEAGLKIPECNPVLYLDLPYHMLPFNDYLSKHKIPSYCYGHEKCKTALNYVTHDNSTLGFYENYIFNDEFFTKYFEGHDNEFKIFKDYLALNISLPIELYINGSAKTLVFIILKRADELFQSGESCELKDFLDYINSSTIVGNNYHDYAEKWIYANDITTSSLNNLLESDSREKFIELLSTSKTKNN